MWHSIIILSFLLCISYCQIIDFIDSKHKYNYHDSFSDPSSLQTYKFHEELSQSAILCPKGSFIKKISYIALLADSNHETVTYSLTDELNVQLPGKKNYCRNFARCLGYQACAFNFGIEFCEYDASPGNRKFFSANVTCLNDDSEDANKFPKDIIDRRNQVTHLKYLSRKSNSGKNTDFKNIQFHPLVLSENDVFVTGCPKIDEISALGYHGDCKAPAKNLDVTQRLWYNLARTSDKTCRKTIAEVYCSHLYNSFGQCIPPHLTIGSKTGSHNLHYNEISLPKKGSRPTETKRPSDVPLRLIPAKLAFSLLCHKSSKAVMQLLDLIYRPQNFYVIHVDSKNSELREELQRIISRKFKNADNIRVLPTERSFRSSWGAYEIVRAQMECFEELLRMGIWDSLINLSESHMPIRDVDDLAASLADQRGNILFSYDAILNSNEKSENELIHTAHYSCGGFIYNITNRSTPKFDDFELHTSSAWAVFPRSFVEYILDYENRNSTINKYQMYLQLLIVPDEHYFANVAFNSKFKDKVKIVSIQEVKPFLSSNDLNLCYHNDDADFCGQGPPDIILNDLHTVETYSHSKFFMRKFQTDNVNSPERKAVIKMMTSYHQSLSGLLPQTLLEKIIQNVMNQQSKSFNSLHHITDLKVLPNLSPSSEACRTPFFAVMGATNHFSYIIDFIMHDRDSNDLKNVRALLNAKPSHICFSNGHLQMMYANLWTESDPIRGRVSLAHAVPIPYHPSNEKSISVVLFFNVANGNGKLNTSDLNFDSLDIKRVTSSPLKTLIQIFNDRKSLVCSEEVIIKWNDKQVLVNKQNPKEERTQMIFNTEILCSSFETGLHTVAVSKIGVSNPTVYTLDLFLLNTDQLSAEFDRKSPYLNDIANLWQVQESYILGNADQKQMEKQRPTIAASHEDEKGFHCKIPGFQAWFECQGGLIIMFLIIFVTYHWFTQLYISPMSVRKQTRKRFKMFIAILFVVILFQLFMYFN